MNPCARHLSGQTGAVDALKSSQPRSRYYKSYYTAVLNYRDSDSRLLIMLEAAIGIEPMNKGFAILAKLFARDRLSVRTCVSVDFLAVPVCL